MSYIIISLFIIFATGILYSYIKKKSIVYLMGFIGLVIWVCALRLVIPNIPNCDAYAYQLFFERAQRFTLKDYYQQFAITEFIFYGFFWICAKMGISYSGVRIIYYLIMVFIVTQIIEEGKLTQNNYFDIIFISTNFILSYCLMRNCMAYLLGWLAVLLVLNKKYFSSFLICVIGGFVHSSCWIVLVFWLFMLAVYKIKSIGIFIVLMMLLYWAIMYCFPAFMMYLGSVNAKVAYYLEKTTGSFAITTNLIRIIVLLMLLILYKPKKTFMEDKNYKNTVLVCAFSLSIICLQLVNGIAYRFLAYFDVLNIIAYGYIRTHETNRRIVMGNYNIQNYILSGMSIVVFVHFISSSLHGYGLIPIRW